ncbi:MAG: tetratricopeptide repeat-containing serine protease family protein [Bacteroidaceae bacterium]|nr:tetratricopeptide repeat-containing serine protease family protein [Bacteroidaceae bacterium]
MKKNLMLVLVFCLLAPCLMAQGTPKWVSKKKAAVFSIITYDKNEKMLNSGNGFFVSEDGVALSDYSLFKGASKAVIINDRGEKMPVEKILGADDLYDVVKFQVGITTKHVPALTLATTPATVGSTVLILPYSTQKSIACAMGKVKSETKIDGKYSYFTLDMGLKDKMVSCPLMNIDGEVLGLVQKSAGVDSATICYAVDVNFAMSKKITALSFNDAVLKGIGIKKELPDTEEQALVYLFMASSQVSVVDYNNLLNDFIQEYPKSSEGYIRRAGYYIAQSKGDESILGKADNDLKTALNVAQNKDDAEYNVAKLIYQYQLGTPQKTYKDWTLDNALEHARKAYEINPVPAYEQLEGDISFAQKKYMEAYTFYDKVNHSNLASSATFFSAAKTKQMLKADNKEVIALMDSCIAYCKQPITSVSAPYLLERALVYMQADSARAAMLDYDAYYKAVNGDVNDLFYYYREQSDNKCHQYQRALDDIAKAVELNPKSVIYRAEQAVVNLHVGRYENAIRILNDAIVIDPTYSEAYRLRGICQLQLKSKTDACESFHKAKELGDTNVDSLIEKYCK